MGFLVPLDFESRASRSGPIRSCRFPGLSPQSRSDEPICPYFGVLFEDNAHAEAGPADPAVSAVPKAAVYIVQAVVWSGETAGVWSADPKVWHKRYFV